MGVGVEGDAHIGMAQTMLDYLCADSCGDQRSGNGRTARIINASSLYHGGCKKMKSLPLSNAINNELAGYYRSLEDSETQLSDQTGKWLDLSPFVSDMLDVFEQCMIAAAILGNSESAASPLRSLVKKVLKFCDLRTFLYFLPLLLYDRIYRYE